MRQIKKDDVKVQINPDVFNEMFSSAIREALQYADESITKALRNEIDHTVYEYLQRQAASVVRKSVREAMKEALK